MGAAQAPRTNDPQADAQAQRHRGVGDDAQNRLAAMQPTGALTSVPAPPPLLVKVIGWRWVSKDTLPLVSSINAIDPLRYLEEVKTIAGNRVEVILALA